MATKDNIFIKPIQQKNLKPGKIVKRAFDICVSIVALIILAPLFGLIGLAIRHDSPGPVFYRGSRIGLGGRLFKILKFRTMYEDLASYQGAKITAQDDPRITPLGRWLRDTKLNELPQLWNVLKGEMSLVGPRPEDPDIAKTWPQDVRNEVLSVRPGITSPASVQYHNEESMLNVQTVFQQYIHELSPDKLRLDQLYVHYRSCWLDLDTLFWTAMILLPTVGSRIPPEELLLVGPISHLIQKYVNWFTIDLFISFFAISFTAIIWRLYAPLNLGWLNSLVMAIGFSFLFSTISVMMGVNRISWSKAALKDIYDLFPAWTLASIIVLMIDRMLGSFPLELILAACVLSLFGFICARFRLRLITGLINRTNQSLTRTTVTRERVLIVGSGRTSEQISWLLDHPTYSSKLQIIGFVDDDLRCQGMRIYGAKIIGTYKDIPVLIKEHDIGVIILADHRIDYSIYASIKEACQDTSTRVVIAPDIFGSIGYLIDELSLQPAFQEKPPEEISFVCQYCLTRFNHQDDKETCQAMWDCTVPEIHPKVQANLQSNYNSSKDAKPKQ